ncbi:glycosyltransferase family 4 protein [Rossellomorea aquimaris]|uniref:glycosyltransferase family 4 protein n=1 Tax=Rossellomorea aquimaris TaxID=189382 RepID=UPI002495969F|nr:glycosyltransferase family 4 protein [Rossellomorea aquimaris]
MELLHICSYYIGNKLYANLIKEFSKSEINQHVFIPLKNDSFTGSNQLPSEYKTINYYYKNILNRYDRFFYFNKTRKQFHEIERSIMSNSKIDFVHAHTLFSDGGTAYKLYQKYGINYIVNVRNTDINVFYKYGVHLRQFMYKVLLNAKAIVFISYAYKKQTLSVLPSNVLDQIENKCYVIPNGIDNYWHEKALTHKDTSSSRSKRVKLLFIGLINKNKNLKTVIQACQLLNSRGYKVSLDVIGDGPLKKQCKELTNKLNMEKTIIFHGYLTDMQSITKIMDNCDIFVMPSFKETFGLVYIEAMSRGIPVIYSQGQGIDGFFENGEVGYSVDPKNSEMLCNVVSKIIIDYNTISQNCLKRANNFQWNSVAEKFKRIYLARE